MKKATIRYCCNALIMGVAVFACGIFAETSVKAEGTPETVPPIESAAPQVTPEVSAVPTVVTPAPTAPPVTLAPVPRVKPLKKLPKLRLCGIRRPLSRFPGSRRSRQNIITSTINWKK